MSLSCSRSSSLFYRWESRRGTYEQFKLSPPHPPWHSPCNSLPCYSGSSLFYQAPCGIKHIVHLPNARWVGPLKSTWCNLSSHLCISWALQGPLPHGWWSQDTALIYIFNGRWISRQTSHYCYQEMGLQAKNKEGGSLGWCIFLTIHFRPVWIKPCKTLPFGTISHYL